MIRDGEEEKVLARSAKEQGVGDKICKAVGISAAYKKHFERIKESFQIKFTSHFKTLLPCVPCENDYQLQSPY